MKRKILFLYLFGLLILNSCKEDKDEMIFFDKPGIEILSAEREGLFGAVFTVKMQPTKEMYEDDYSRYICGMEYSTDSQFRRSFKVGFGNPGKKNAVKTARLNLFPDSVYYFRPIVVFLNNLSGFFEGNTGNRILKGSDEIICMGSVVTIGEVPIRVDDYLRVKIEQVGPMNISCSVEKDNDKMYEAQAGYDNYYIHFSEDSTFSTLGNVYEFKHYENNAVTNVKTLNPSSDYYIRVGFCHIIHKDTVSYFGKPIKVSTSALPKANGKEYVDLGLSVMWATCNVGAASTEEPGGYYCWGEIEELMVNGVRLEDIDYTNDIPTYSKYTPDDGLSTLDLVDDVAAVKWGGNWHIPDKSDFDELCKNCDHYEEVIINGKKALKIISRINGNYIYFPLGGWYSGGEYRDWPEAYLWSRNVYDVGNYGMAYCFRGGNFLFSYFQYHRRIGVNVRPVFKP